jgi:hypothetical protein
MTMTKNRFLSLALIGLSIVGTMSSSASFAGSHSVKGHITKNGSYVPPSYATNPDGTKLNNWSTQGHVNPYTGKVGTVDPYKPKRVK